MYRMDANYDEYDREFTELVTEINKFTEQMDDASHVEFGQDQVHAQVHEYIRELHSATLAILPNLACIGDDVVSNQLDKHRATAADYLTDTLSKSIDIERDSSGMDAANARNIRDALKRKFGFIVESRKSSIDDPSSGFGVYIDGEACQGTVLAIYPGTVFPNKLLKDNEDLVVGYA